MAFPLNETHSRRHPRIEGVAVVLGDGQAWTLAKPMVGAYPEIDPDGTIRFAKVHRSFGSDYDTLVDRFLEAETDVEALPLLAALALDLLRRNYTLGDPVLLKLLPRWGNDEDNDAMWRNIADVALGRSPKPTAVG